MDRSPFRLPLGNCAGIPLPVTPDLARERGIPPSKLLMPLSSAASLGSTITLIGAPAFLIVNSLLVQAGRPRLGIFSIAMVGLSLSLRGALFILLFGRFLLQMRTEGDEVLNRFRMVQIICAALVYLSHVCYSVTRQPCAKSSVQA